ncbi:hypothetical protein NDU88_000666 [Pleurodeles waltl]|uniref:Uncharacterized protein n=1 Tax=Pleurodeles waltl TaxID=8319 RepID=A0AAV7P4J2_PLEWA|nr:hypothetical protein NDU88_000666 [Pleurodeles waltl]
MPSENPRAVSVEKRSSRTGEKRLEGGRVRTDRLCRWLGQKYNKLTLKIFLSDIFEHTISHWRRRWLNFCPNIQEDFYNGKPRAHLMNTGVFVESFNARSAQQGKRSLPSNIELLDPATASRRSKMWVGQLNNYLSTTRETDDTIKCFSLLLCWDEELAANFPGPGENDQ